MKSKESSNNGNSYKLQHDAGDSSRSSLLLELVEQLEEGVGRVLGDVGGVQLKVEGGA